MFDTFIDKCVRREIQLDRINDYIDYWQHEEIDIQLDEYLGMTKDEYSRWVVNPNEIHNIILNRLVNLSNQH